MRLVRKVALKRHGRIRTRRKKPRRGPRRDRAYMDWIKTLPCCVVWQHCEGPIDPSHTGERGLGQKADDRTCIPKCRKHHEEWETHRGAFNGWTREERRAWAAAQVAIYQDKFEEREVLL